MTNQPDLMRGNLTIDMMVSFILSSLIITLPFLALLLIKYPLGSLWSLWTEPLGSSSTPRTRRRDFFSFVFLGPPPHAKT